MPQEVVNVTVLIRGLHMLPAFIKNSLLKNQNLTCRDRIQFALLRYPRKTVRLWIISGSDKLLQYISPTYIKNASVIAEVQCVSQSPLPLFPAKATSVDVQNILFCFDSFWIWY